ncbi:helix-turn-helix domain-containing protein [Actinobacillus porcinus]|uniref:helix-turn-helix domain-containing protein n=1 Tax=Actinobacillus porcinus TaxID=51048 RepID=UPI002352C1FC|nr:helix-turn-helix transcriptional regulator [Actinobacillus porcinus]MDD7544309.1 helix-turn-helix transcriptional regulator [Actinobacillus porcinus]MDY5420597.1 helix-turn-helix transcriptional regulator [Actinobacillus porcinus]MDY5847565.1 helix-turn-helix transcriptional regulator [Actinobacillus porcinus]
MNKEEREILLKQLGLSIKLERVRKGLSQEDLAELSGLHRTYIGMVERAERNISVLNLVLIAKALDISIDTLLNWR